MANQILSKGTGTAFPMANQKEQGKDSSGRPVEKMTAKQTPPIGVSLLKSSESRLPEKVKEQGKISSEVVLLDPQSSKKGEEAETLRKYFQMEPSISKLPQSEQERIFSYCLKAYQSSVSEYEKAAGEVAFNHPKAQDFAKTLVQRLAIVMDIYYEILDEESQVNPQSKNPLFSREFMSLMRTSQRFGNDSTGAGSAGMNPLTIKKVLNEGNLREQMTLVYRSCFSFFVSTVLDNPELTNKINARLIEKGAGFQIDTAALKEDNSRGQGLFDVGSYRALKQCPVVDLFRNVEKKRINKKQPKVGAEVRGQRLNEVPGLSVREARIGTSYRVSDQNFEQEKNTSRLEWIPGKDWVGIDPSSTFAKETESLGSLPTLTGPSGTTDGVLHVARYLELGGEHTEAGMLAYAGWMIPVGDHTLHEIRSSANYYGIAYEGLPEDFNTLASSDPTVVEQIDQKLAQKGLENPSYYFSPKFQLIAKNKLGIVDRDDASVARHPSMMRSGVSLEEDLTAFPGHDHILQMGINIRA